MTEGDILAGLPEALRHEVEDFAKATQRSHSLVVTEALEAYMEDQRAYRAAVDEAIKESDETGEFISWEATRRWLESWGTDNELPPPEPDIFLKK